MAEGKYDIASIITHEFHHEKLAEAIETAAQTDRALNVVINHGVRSKKRGLSRWTAFRLSKKSSIAGLFRIYMVK